MNYSINMVHGLRAPIANWQGRLLLVKLVEKCLYACSDLPCLELHVCELQNNEVCKSCSLSSDHLLALFSDWKMSVPNRSKSGPRLYWNCFSSCNFETHETKCWNQRMLLETNGKNHTEHNICSKIAIHNQVEAEKRNGISRTHTEMKEQKRRWEERLGVNHTRSRISRIFRLVLLSCCSIFWMFCIGACSYPI